MCTAPLGGGPAPRALSRALAGALEARPVPSAGLAAPPWSVANGDASCDPPEPCEWPDAAVCSAAKRCPRPRARRVSSPGTATNAVPCVDGLRSCTAYCGTPWGRRHLHHATTPHVTRKAVSADTMRYTTHLGASLGPVAGGGGGCGRRVYATRYDDIWICAWNAFGGGCATRVALYGRPLNSPR